MDIISAKGSFARLQEQLTAYENALGLLELDGATCAPPDSADGRGATGKVLAEASYRLEHCEETELLLEYLHAHAEELNAAEKRQLELMDRQKARIANVPKEDYLSYRVLTNKAADVWRRAKRDNDFASFAPYLRDITDALRSFALLSHPEQKPYDTMLDSFEHGLNTAAADVFFDTLRRQLVPLIREISAAPQPDTAFLHQHCPVWRQRILSDRLMDIMKADRGRISIGETEHPFTIGFGSHDTRITTHYYEDDFTSSMFSVMHETGHAIYEMNCADEYDRTLLRGGVSMGIHESQSRFYENLIGRSEAFLTFLLPVLREVFPGQFDSITAGELYAAVNKSSPSLIRIHADELTYPLHIMVRYDLEKAIIGDRMDVRDIPEAWHEKMREYLGIDVPDDSRGCLQDSHWSSGQIGYFPSYALGSAYGAQFLKKMGETVDVEEAVRTGHMERITAWLCEHLHRHGRMYDPDVLLNNACGGPFDPSCYTEYLTRKYSALYHL